MKLTEGEQEILASACSGGWYVDVDNFDIIAKLKKRGWVKIVDRDEGALGICGTDRGISYCFRTKLLERSDTPYSGGFAWGPNHPSLIRRRLKGALRE